MKAVFLSILIGYFLGSLSPSYVVAMLKKVDLRHKGTGNLGATNVFCSVGKVIGVLVMLFDILKAFAAVTISSALFDEFVYAGVLSGSAAVLGHIFPFYLHFRGGKGTACFGGMILGLKWEMFIPLLFVSLAIAIIANYLFIAPVFASAVFPLAYSVLFGDAVSFLILSAACTCIVVKHGENFRKIKERKEPQIRCRAIK